MPFTGISKITMSENLKWKLLSSSYIHKGPWATLRTDKCEMPDGRIVDEYYVLEYPNWVNGVAFTNEGKVLMVRQYRHAAGIVSLEIPGGVIDGDEKPEDAMRRELLEETGYQFDKIELLSTVYANPSTANNKTFCYLATGGVKVQEQALDEHEEVVVEQYTIEEVKQLLADNKIAQALHCTGLFYALSKLNKL
ncbi:ADP-ribose pyrophosphatase YjhB (NUDIX family) [Mucilaginibacter auburnensis]|uniref:GDP-mannose pyrophosphatase n=2 Tax=Mucilaginibacter auburnensis TaxID=1457233 RepID=A0A2H9VT61_9SPHI|nr:ADP-ribose pyrophosphatase YjhB (NUDIX family) [Mucilaginibacter auburnensis]